MNRGGTVATPRPVSWLEVTFAVCLGAAYALLSLPFPELALIYAPQLVLLAFLAGTLALLDARFPEARARAIVAIAASLAFGAIGVAFMWSTSLKFSGIEWVLALPYAIGAGVTAGTWVARPGSRLPRLLLRAFEAGTGPVVLYAAAGLLIVATRT